MIPNGLLLNIGIIILSGGIIFSYLRPTFAEVRADQDVIAEYRTEIEKVESTNARLQSLISEVAQMTDADRARLVRYLPPEVDMIMVQRDLLSIADVADITLETLEVGEEEAPASPVAVDAAVVATAPASTLVPYTLSTSFTTTYENAKSFLNLLTTNEYPLHIVELQLSGSAASDDEEELSVVSDEVAVELTLETYALQILSVAE